MVNLWRVSMNNLLAAVAANNRFLGHTNPIMTAAIADGGSVQDREYIQRAARGIVDAGHLDNLKLWVCAGLPKLRNSGGVDYVPKLYDISGNGNNGIQTTEAYQPYITANSLYFDGTDDVLVVPYDADMDLQTLTLMFWVKRFDTTLATNDTFLGRGAATTPTDVPFRFKWNATPAIEFNFVNNGSSYISTDKGGIATTANVWFHYAGVFEKSGSNTIITLYRNGSDVDTDTAAALVPTRTTDLYIGAENNRRWIGCEENDIRLYNAALTEAEILAIYNQTSYRYA